MCDVQQGAAHQCQCNSNPVHMPTYKVQQYITNFSELGRGYLRCVTFRTPLFIQRRQVQRHNTTTLKHKKKCSISSNFLQYSNTTTQKFKDTLQLHHNQPDHFSSKGLKNDNTKTKTQEHINTSLLRIFRPLHNVYFVQYNVRVSFMAL